MNVKTEKIAALFAANEMGQKATLLASQTIYRTSIGGKRYYTNKVGRSHLSVTTFLAMVEPKNPQLESWRMQKAMEFQSTELADEFVKATADYGTALHIGVADFVKNGHIDWEKYYQDMYLYIHQYVSQKEETALQATKELVIDTASIIKFLFDYEVEVLAVELPVFKAIGEAGLATCIDLVVTMNEKHYTEKTPKESRKRINAIINLKSGRKGFQKTHANQLALERMLFNETYGAIFGEIEEVFNVAPSDFKNEPTYKVKRQTDQMESLTAMLNLDIQKMFISGTFDKVHKNEPAFFGITKYGQDPTLALKRLDILDFIMNNNNTI